MKVVVTGSEGFIGQRVVSWLCGHGYSVFGIDSVDSGQQKNLERFELCRGGLEQIRSDHFKIWRDESAFSVIHLAWNMNRQDDGYAKQSETLAAFAGLLDQCAALGAMRVVGMGSAEEYGNLEGELTEHAAPNHFQSAYGWAKYAAGMLLREWSYAKKIPTVWVRPFVVYGREQQGNMLIPYAVRCATRKERAEFTDGLQQRDFIHVDDVTRAITSALNVELEQAFSIFNAGTGRPVAVRSVLERIADHLSAKESFQFGAKARRENEPDVQFANIRNARNILGWEPTISWEEGIDQVCVKGLNNQG